MSRLPPSPPPGASAKPTPWRVPSMPKTRLEITVFSEERGTVNLSKAQDTRELPRKGLPVRHRSREIGAIGKSSKFLWNPPLQVLVEVSSESMNRQPAAASRRILLRCKPRQKKRRARKGTFTRGGITQPVRG